MRVTSCEACPNEIAKRNPVKNAREIAYIEESRKYERWGTHEQATSADEYIKISTTHEVGHSGLLYKMYEQHRSQGASIDDTPVAIMVKQTMQRAKDEGDIYKLSQYSASSPREFFAESFAQYTFHKGKLPGYIVDMVEEVIGNDVRAIKGR